VNVGRACRHTSTTIDQAAVAAAAARRTGQHARLLGRSSPPPTPTVACPTTTGRPSATPWQLSTSPSRRPDASWKETSTPPSGTISVSHYSCLQHCGILAAGETSISVAFLKCIISYIPILAAVEKPPLHGGLVVMQPVPKFAARDHPCV